jgi:hypothetical protein
MTMKRNDAPDHVADAVHETIDELEARGLVETRYHGPPDYAYSRQRGFKPAERGNMTWWILGVTQEGATAFGTETIYLEEIVSSQSAGDIAVYRHWISDPDGHEYTGRIGFGSPAPTRSKLLLCKFSGLRSAIGTMKMKEVAL